VFTAKVSPLTCPASSINSLGCRPMGQATGRRAAVVRITPTTSPRTLIALARLPIIAGNTGNAAGLPFASHLTARSPDGPLESPTACPRLFTAKAMLAVSPGSGGSSLVVPADVPANARTPVVVLELPTTAPASFSP
jgi:hypothetical protein